jgi:uncharacterized membrane protein YraQ (UPF0718 family)
MVNITRKTIKTVQWSLLAALGAGAGASFLLDYAPGIRAGRSFAAVMIEMLKILPCAFVLLALFEEWGKRETVVRHLGGGRSLRGYLWAVLLGGMTIGGLFVAFPVAASLHKKGASLRVIFAYLGFAGVCRIPMTLFEASFLGPKFTVVRLAVSIPLMLLAGVALGGILERKEYQITE